MSRRSLILVMIALTARTNALAAQTTLAWRFQTGDTFSVQERIVQTTALETKNKPFQQKSELTLTARWQVKDVAADLVKLRVVVEGYASKISAGDGKRSVSSKDDELWPGAEFVLTLDQQGRLKDLKGREELLKKLAGNNPQKLKVLSALKPADSFEALFQDVLGPLPEGPVRKGDRWQRSATDAMSIFGSFEQSTTFTYDGARDGLQTIRSATKTVYKAPRYAIENDVFRVLKGDVQANDSAGELLFDAEKGRMRRVEKTSRLRGELTLETLSGMQKVAFTSATEVTIEVK